MLSVYIDKNYYYQVKSIYGEYMVQITEALEASWQTTIKPSTESESPIPALSNHKLPPSKIL